MLEADDNDRQSGASKHWRVVPAVLLIMLTAIAIYIGSYWIFPNPATHAKYIPSFLYRTVSQGYSRFYYPLRRFQSAARPSKHGPMTLRVHRVTSKYLDTRFMTGKMGTYFCFDPDFRDVVYSLREGDIVEVSAESRPNPLAPIDERWITSIRKK